MSQQQALGQLAVGLRHHLVVDQVWVGNGGGAAEGFCLHDHVSEHQVGTVGIELRQLAGLTNASVSVLCLCSIADIEHKLRSKHLVEVIYLSVGVVVKLEVVLIVGEILGAERGGQRLGSKCGLLYPGQSRVETILPLRGEEEVIGGGLPKLEVVRVDSVSVDKIPAVYDCDE